MLAVLACAGCGGIEHDVARAPDPVVATVGDTRVSAADVQRLVDDAELAYRAQGLEPPAPGSAAHDNLRAIAIEVAAHRAWIEEAAERAGVAVTAAEVDAFIAELEPRAEVERTLREQGMTWQRLRADTRRHLLENETYVAVTRALPHERRIATMHAWVSEAERRILIRYEPGWRPSDLRRPVPPVVPDKPQRPLEECGLRGTFTYQELVARGCAGDFSIPGRDGPPCEDLPPTNPYFSGFDELQVESGYADYLLALADEDETVCVPDPTGAIVTVGVGLPFDPAPDE